MEDIKILESFINQLEEYEDEEKLKQAIQNLITGYKKLEKQMENDLSVVYFKGAYDERDTWKSKVKEKMKKYEWAIEHYDCDEADYKQSQDVGSWHVLQELLEGDK